ncbi:MAG TPA: acyl carrier protein [Candidatus Binatia bacterium]
MDAEEIEKRVVQLVRETVPESGDLTGEFILLGEGGAFDSVTALQLVLALEKEFGIVVKDDDVQPENLRNLETIVNFVKSALSRPK